MINKDGILNFSNNSQEKGKDRNQKQRKQTKNYKIKGNRLYVYIFCQISENFRHYFLSIFSVLSSLSPLRTLMARILDLLLWSQDPWGFLFKALLSNFRLFWVSVIQLGSFYCFVFHLTNCFLLPLHFPIEPNQRTFHFGFILFCIKISTCFFFLSCISLQCFSTFSLVSRMFVIAQWAFLSWLICDL